MYLQLGDIRFEALLGFESFTDSVEATYAEHQLIGRKPRLQRTGDTLREFNGTIHFHSSFCDPYDEYQKLEAKRVSGEFLPLIYGNGTYEGDFILKSLSRTPNQTDNNGNYVSLTCNITLVESEGANALSQRKEQARTSAFALTSNRPLPIAASVNDVANPALDVMNENKTAQQGVAGMAAKLEEVDKAIARVTDPINEEIAKAQAFFEMSPSVTAKLNRYINSTSASLNAIQALLGSNPAIALAAPLLTAQVATTKTALLAVQNVVTEIASLPTVNTLADALYVLNVQKNSVTLGRQLAVESKNLNSAAAPVAAAIAAKVKF